jgi:hypothetical protein
VRAAVFVAAVGIVLVVDGVAGAATPVTGTLTLKPFNPQNACKFSKTVTKVTAGPVKAGSKVLLAQCSAHGTFTGSVKVVDAGYGWNWYLQISANGKTTGVAAEYGAVTLSPVTGGLIELLTVGIQSPVGPQTSAHAKGMTKGTWKAKSGQGTGTYTFTTERNGSTFTSAVLHLSGSVG